MMQPPSVTDVDRAAKAFLASMRIQAFQRHPDRPNIVKAWELYSEEDQNVMRQAARAALEAVARNARPMS